MNELYQSQTHRHSYALKPEKLLVFALNFKKSSNPYMAIKREKSFSNTGKHKCREWSLEIVQGSTAYGEA